MMKYDIVNCEGYWLDDPDHILGVSIALDSWDGLEDGIDESIFYYMDGEPLKVGSIISEGFLITEMEG
jgi:hypothetical protein